MKLSDNAAKIVEVLGTEFLTERVNVRQRFQDARQMIEYTDAIVKMAIEIPRFFDKSTPEGTANMALLLDLIRKGDRNGVKQFIARVLPYYEAAMSKKYHDSPQVKQEHGGLPLRR